MVRVSLFGATLTSWQVEGTELIFVSPNAVFDDKKAIRFVHRLSQRQSWARDNTDATT